ncbi:MAG: biliverdin-producing heme oxygenase [Rhodospirillaceae bacterium]
MAFNKVRKALREATTEVHLRIQAHPLLLTLAGAGLTPAGYRQALEVLYGVHAAADRALAEQWPQRRPRAPMIAADLAVLGGGPIEPAIADTLPAFRSHAGFLGGRYVIDGSAFGGLALLGNIRRVLNLDATNGAGFFSGGSLDTTAEWRSLLAMLEDLNTSGERDEACRAAVACFEAIKRWIDHCATAGPAA